MVFPLRKIIEEYETIDKASFEGALSSFSCQKDLEVQTFLQNKAVDFENAKQTSTFLLFNDDASKNGVLQLDGYFSLALKVFSFSADISNRQRRSLSGKSEREVPAYLIGQLARDDNAPRGTGKELIHTAIQYIRNAQFYVGGRIVYLDCKDALKSYYENYGFRYIQKSARDPQLNQMYLII